MCKPLSEVFDSVHKHIRLENDCTEDLKILTMFGEVLSISGIGYYEVQLCIEVSKFEKGFNKQTRIIIKLIQEFDIKKVSFKIISNYIYSIQFVTKHSYIFKRILAETNIEH